MIILNQSIKTMQNYATCKLTALLFILKLKKFMNILRTMLQKDLINQIMKSIGHCLLEKQKSDWINER